MKDFLRERRAEAYQHNAKHLAIRAGVSASTIYAFRSGRTAWPRKETLFALLDVMGYELEMKKK